MLEALGFVADALILFAYASKRPRWFDWANVLSAPILLAVEITTGAWAIIPITVSFGLIGAWHLVTQRHSRG